MNVWFILPFSFNSCCLLFCKTLQDWYVMNMFKLYWSQLVMHCHYILWHITWDYCIICVSFPVNHKKLTYWSHVSSTVLAHIIQQKQINSHLDLSDGLPMKNTFRQHTARLEVYRWDHPFHARICLWISIQSKLASNVYSLLQTPIFGIGGMNHHHASGFLS